jgi:hypothetical protein
VSRSAGGWESVRLLIGFSAGDECVGGKDSLVTG